MVLSKDVKFAICFGLIIGALFSFCSMCFASDVENLDFIVANNLSFTIDNPVIQSSASSMGYIVIEPGYLYTFTASPNSGKNIGFSNSAPAVGVVVQDTSAVGRGRTFSFSYKDYSYLYFDYYNYSDLETITRVPLQGMDGVIDNLAYTLSLSNVWQIVGFVVPVLAIAILVVLGFYLVNRLINRIKRKKGGV